MVTSVNLCLSLFLERKKNTKGWVSGDKRGEENRGEDRREWRRGGEGKKIEKRKGRERRGGHKRNKEVSKFPNEIQEIKGFGNFQPRTSQYFSGLAVLGIIPKIKTLL